jgi:hypothetical protein
MTDEAIKAFLANGGVIQQVAVGVSGITEGSTYSLWGAPRKPGRPPAVDTPVKVIEPADLDDGTTDSTE